MPQHWPALAPNRFKRLKISPQKRRPDPNWPARPRPCEKPLRTRGRSGAEAGRGVGQLSGDAGNGAGGSCRVSSGAVRRSQRDKEAAAARVRQAQGAIAEVESYIGDARVYAPVTGEASGVIAEAGELVGEGYPVDAILDLSDKWVCCLISRRRCCLIFASAHGCGVISRLWHADVELVGDLYFAQADFANGVGDAHAKWVR